MADDIHLTEDYGKKLSVLEGEMKSRVWRSGQALSLVLIFIIGCMLIVMSSFWVSDERLSNVFIGIGIALAPAAVIAQLYRIFLFDEIRYELNKPLEQLRELLEIVSTVGKDITPLKNEVSILKQSIDQGLLNIHKGRSNALKGFQDAIDSEDDEIMIIGSSLKGLLLSKDYAYLNSKINHKITLGVNILFMLTHPSVADLRARLEDRDPTKIGREIISSLKILKSMGVPEHNVKLYKGTPTIFGIRTKLRMIINPYPYKSQAMTSPCFELEAEKSLYDAYSEKHFGAWDTVMAEGFSDWDRKIIELEQNLDSYAQNIIAVLQ